MHGRIPSVSQKPNSLTKPADEDVLLGQLLDFFYRRWELIAITALAVAALAFAVVMTLTPRYTATAQILLEQRKEKLFGADSIVPEFNLDTGNVDSQISVIQSLTLLKRVVEKYKLTEDPEFGVDDPPSLYVVMKQMIFGAKLKDEAAETLAANAPGYVEPHILKSIKRLERDLAVTRVGRTYVISIGVTSKDPMKAVKLANAVADAYVVDRLDARYDAAKRASTWMAERLEGLRDLVRMSEEAVAKFRQENNLTISSEGKVAVSEQQLSDLNARMVAARADSAEKHAKLDQAQKVKNAGGSLQNIPDVVRSNVISELRKQESEVTRKEADAAARYSDAHPTVVNARAERRDIERSISAEVGRIIANLKNDFDVAKAREASLQASLDALTGKDGGDGSVGVKLRELERTNLANKSLFENFLSRSKLTQEQSSFEERESRILSPAVKPTDPSFPKKSLVLALASLAGIVLGAVSGVALDMLNSGFSAPREIEATLGRPVLSTIPMLPEHERRLDGKLEDPINFLLKKPLSRYAEQVRALRVGVQMTDVDNPPQVLLLTSSVPKEGKSTLAASFAYSAAKSGLRVVLVDCDFRHPSTTEYFGMQGKQGLVDVLTGAQTLEGALVTAGSIVVLAAGSPTQNPGDLLGSQRMKQVIANLRTAYDLIIIDTPPVAPVIDAKVITRLVDKIIFVVRWQSTPREIVSQCLDQLEADEKLAGIALNLINEAKSPRYGPYSYYSGNKYGSYYK